MTSTTFTGSLTHNLVLLVRREFSVQTVKGPSVFIPHILKIYILKHTHSPFLPYPCKLISFVVKQQEVEEVKRNNKHMDVCSILQMYVVKSRAENRKLYFTCPSSFKSAF